MEHVIPKLQLILVFSYVTFIAHTLAEPPEAVKDAFIAYRQRQREVGLNMQSFNWAGTVQVSPPSGTFNHVSAQWVVPTVSPPYANVSGTWFISEWVGIDGDTCQRAILQTGIVSYVDVSDSGNVTTGASTWYEWLPEGPVTFSNFSIAAGDTVEVSVTAKSKSRGIAVIKNLCTGKSTSTAFSAPNNSRKLCGMNAEWILEDFGPTFFGPIAKFTNVTFQNCKATTTKGATVNLLNTTLFDIVRINNYTLATTTLINSTEFRISYG